MNSHSLLRTPMIGRASMLNERLRERRGTVGELEIDAVEEITVGGVGNDEQGPDLGAVRLETGCR